MPSATASVIGIAIHPLNPTFRRNQAITNAIAVATTIIADNSPFKDAKNPIKRLGCKVDCEVALEKESTLPTLSTELLLLFLLFLVKYLVIIFIRWLKSITYSMYCANPRRTNFTS